MTAHDMSGRAIHERSLELAALAIDFKLTRAQTAVLEGHLAGCPACTRRAAALRADAVALGRPLDVLPSARVDAAIAAAIAGRRTRPQRLVLVAAAALLALALLGAAAVGAYLLRSVMTTPITEVSLPTVPVVIASPDPSTVPAEQEPGIAATWERLAIIPGAPATHGVAGGPLRDLVGFGGGYVAISGARTAWYSPDGRAWEKSVLPFPDGVSEFGQPLDATVDDIASNGRQVVIVGAYSRTPCGRPSADVGGGPRCPLSPISWTTEDGRTWRSSHPWPGPDEPPGFEQGSEFVAIWPVPTGGWDATLAFWEGESLTGRDVWHSDDGVAWTALAPPSLPTDVSGHPETAMAIADATGRRLAWQTWQLNNDGIPTGQETWLAASPDGRAWRSLDGFPGRGARVTTGLAPASGGSRPWFLAGAVSVDRGASSTPTIWASSDLTSWTATSLPTSSAPSEACVEQGKGETCSLVVSIDGVIAIEGGHLAVGSFLDDGFGYAGAQAWLSRDGVSWVDLGPSAFGRVVVADGPAGVIAIGVPDRDEDTVAAWRLDLSTRSPSAVASAEPSGPVEPTPFVPPSPLCPAPAAVVEPPPVAASAGGRLAVFTALGSSTTTTCSTTGTSDAGPISPSEPLIARPGELISLTVPTGWRFVRWEGSDSAVVGEGANVWPATDLADPSSRLEVPVPNRAGDSTVNLDVVVVSVDGRVVMTLALQLLVRVG